MAIWYIGKELKKEIVKDEIGSKLIYRDGIYYLWYICGWKDDYPYMEEIEESVAKDIIRGKKSISEVLDEKYNEYKEKQEYDKLISERYHINTGLSNYLKREEGKNDKEIEDIINKFDKDLYLKWEFYNTVMYRNFPYRGRMKEEEIEKIFNEENCSYLNTYLRILEMRK